MTEGYIFSLSTLAGWGGGYPVPGLGRGNTPSQVWVGGVPHPRSRCGQDPILGLGREGGTPSQVWVGEYPIPGLGGTPSQVWIVGGGTPSHLRSGWWGVPHVRSRWGVPHLRSRGVPHLRSGW